MQPVPAEIRLVAVHGDVVEEGVDRRPQARHRLHRGDEVLDRDRVLGAGRALPEMLGKIALLVLAQQIGPRRAGVGRLVLLLLDADDVAGAAVGHQQVRAVIAVEKFLQCIGAGDETLPIWILNNFSRPNQLPIVNVVAVFVILISIIPVYLAHKLSSEVDSGATPAAAPATTPSARW